MRLTLKKETLRRIDAGSQHYIAGGTFTVASLAPGVVCGVVLSNDGCPPSENIKHCNYDAVE